MTSHRIWLCLIYFRSDFLIRGAETFTHTSPVPTFDKIEVVLFSSLWKISFSHTINLPAWKWKWFTVGAWSSQWCWEYGGRCRLEGGRSQGRFDHYINCPLPPPAPHHCHHIWTHSQDYQADTDQEIHLTLIFDLTWLLHYIYDKFYVMLWLWAASAILGRFWKSV